LACSGSHYGFRLIRGGHVANIVTTATSPLQIRLEPQRKVPNLSELESARKFFLSDWHTWMTGKKSEEGISVNSLSVVKMGIDQSRFRKEFGFAYDFVGVDNFSTALKYNDERPFMQWFDNVSLRV